MEYSTESHVSSASIRFDYYYYRIYWASIRARAMLTDLLIHGARKAYILLRYTPVCSWCCCYKINKSSLRTFVCTVWVCELWYALRIYSKWPKQNTDTSVIVTHDLCLCDDCVSLSKWISHSIVRSVSFCSQNENNKYCVSFHNPHSRCMNAERHRQRWNKMMPAQTKWNECIWILIGDDIVPNIYCVSATYFDVLSYGDTEIFICHSHVQINIFHFPANVYRWIWFPV